MGRMKLILVFLALIMAGPAWAEEQYIRLGVFPYVNPATLIKHHKDFINHLEHSSGLKIQILTSPDYKTFLQRTKNNEFDLVLTAPHFGRLAEQRDGYQRVAMTQHKVQGIYIVKSGSSIKNLKQLTGKKVTIAAPTSIVYRLAQKQLQQEYGYVNGKNINIVPTGTHNNAMFAVLKGESEVGVTGIKLFEGILKQRGPVLKKIGETATVPGFMLMANKNVAKKRVTLFRNAALSFAQTEAGHYYVFKGYREIDDRTMKSLDAYITDLR